MPRHPRFTIPDGSYHVIARGNNKNPIFHDDEDKEVFLEILRDNKRKYTFKLYHFALMENHYHLIVHFATGPDLSAAMKRINIMYVKHYRRKYGGIGHFFQDRFKSIPIQKGDYMSDCSRYVELNPVKSGEVEKPEDSPWTSYRTYMGEQNDLVDFDPEYLGLSEDAETRRNLYRTFVMKKTTERRSLTRYFKQGVYGNKKFAEWLVKKWGLIQVWSHAGRPKQMAKRVL